ncbi:hypothetical protein Esi_0173_0036 [Ectocarpus siliculosus]|uniref:Uncharacterized protein n=1 Tax=Ectocarpus siliculosus TaxID=2880 RepID=D7FN22_ECTSI|nr:hypothetical protein Esi_0173_0036 [Ectocarpus siliculosus]|eukprot:CBJ30086.1 hypothetical protein Esi_0173_0036 [Ectocarpus siliculosus]
MPGPPWSAGTRMFSSVDDSSDSSDTSSECWNPRSPGQHSIGSRPSGGDVSPSKLALPALATALRASRARAAAAQAKASRKYRLLCASLAAQASKAAHSGHYPWHRLLEETGRLRDSLKVARKGEERANRCETELAKSETRARELESDNRRLRRDLDGARLRTRQNEAKARSSLSTLRASLEDLDHEQRARCKRWRATTRSQRALLESLRRHVQRGLHSAPSFTAFQLIEQIFGCLETLESDAQLSPARRRRQRSPSAACSPPADPSPPHRRGSPKRSPHVAAAAAGPRVTVKGLTPIPSGVSDRLDDEEATDLRTGRGRSLPAAIDGGGGGGGGGGGSGGYFSSDGDGSGGGSSGSQEDFQAQEGGGGRTTARFSTEWAYRLAVTKLTAQLKATRERLHGEKEAARSAGDRVEQEELRCRQLELEVEGLSSKVAAADGHRRRLEAMLKETKRERDALRRRQNSTAATQTLSAALGILHQRQASSSPAYPPAPQPPPPPPPPPPAAFAATPQAPVAATPPTPQAPAVYPATGSEALYNHGRDAPRLEPSALASACSPDGDGAWWEGGEGAGVERRHGQRHQPQQHTAAPDTGDGFPGSPAAPAVRGGAEREPPRSARHAEGAGVGGRELLTRRDIQRIVDDAVMNGTGRRGAGDGGGGDDVAGVGDSRAAGAELPGVGYRWRDTALGYGTSSLLGGGGGGGGGGRRSAAAAAAAAATAAPTAAAAFSGRRRDTAWLSSRPPITAIGRTPAERGIGAGAARVGGPPPRPKATNSEVGGGKNGGGGSVRFGGGSSLGPRAVTREDLTRLDNEIANLSKTVEQAAMAQTRQILRNVAD